MRRLGCIAAAAALVPDSGYDPPTFTIEGDRGIMIGVIDEAREEIVRYRVTTR